MELARIPLKIGVVTLRRALRSDVADLAALITADPIAHGRGDTPDAQQSFYFAAFDAIDADAGQLLVTAEVDDVIVGTFQLSFIPGLARRGALRAQIEAVRVHANYRDRGLGAAMMRWAIEEAHRRGCTLVQLASDRARPDAHRFYERLGFEASHIGFKLSLPQPHRTEI